MLESSFYDTGAGGQYPSGAIAKSLGDVLPYTFKLKKKIDPVQFSK